MKRDEVDVMAVSLAVARKVVTREQARAAVGRITEGAPAARALGLPDELVRDAAALSDLPAGERSECLEIFKDLFPLTRALHDQPTLIESRPAGAPGAAPAIGGRLGRYLLQEELGRGGMGVVYKAWDGEMERAVAVKCMLRADDPTELARFEREARTSVSLTHPNIVRVYEVGVHEGTPFIAMEFVPGRPLADLLDPRPGKGRKLPLDRALGLVRDAAFALGHAHERNIVHRDVKPQNIMVTEAGEVKVMDFGLAREARRGMTVTSTGDVIGTPAYMSPEQARGEREKIGPRTDVWALGVMLYESTARSSPFDGETPAEVLHRVTHEDPVPPRKRNPRIPKDLETVILKCLEQDPQDRYATGTRLAEDLGRHLEGLPVTARRPSLFKRLKRKALRRKGVLLAAAAGVIAVALVSAVLLPKLGSARRDADTANRAASEARKAVLDQLRQTTDAALSAALGFRQQGRLDEMDRFLKKTEESCRKAMAELPGEAEPHYRLGRMFRVLSRDAEALAEQERALAIDATYARSRYERVVLNARKYRKRAVRLQEETRFNVGQRLALMGGGEVKAGVGVEFPTWAEVAAGDAEATDLRKRIEGDVARLESAVDAISPMEIKCARALAAWAIGETERAREILLPILEKGEGLEEMYETLASAEHAARRFEESDRWWTEGLRKDQGNIPYYLGRASARSMAAAARDRRGDPSEALWKGSIEDSSKVIEWRPKEAHAWLQRGTVRSLFGSRLIDKGTDPGAAFQGAIEDLSEVIRNDPSDVNGWFSRALARFDWGTWRQGKGEPFEDLFKAALPDLEETVARNPRVHHPWIVRAMIHSALALSLQTRKDAAGAEREYLAAIADYGEALKRDSRDANFWMMRGFARGIVANGKAGRKEESDADYKGAVDDLGEAARIAPGAHAQYRVGAIALRWGHARVGRRVDPAQPYRQAIESFDRAVGLDAKHAMAWRDRGVTRYYWSRWKMNVDPNADLLEEVRRAVADLEEAIRLRPALEDPLRAILQETREYFKLKEGK